MRRYETVRRKLSKHNPAAVLLDGMETALVGWTRRLGGLAVYDRELCIRALVTTGMTRESAEEFFWSNVEGAWMGEYAPVIVNRPARGFDEEAERWDGQG